MARLESWYKQDLKKPLIVHKHADVFNQDSRGNLIGVEVYSNGDPVTLTGSISGYCLLADGTTVPAVGASRSGNKASVLIPQTAYSVPGPITITIKNVEGNDIATLCAVVGLVRQSVSGNLVNPGSVVTDWSNSINAQLQAVQTAADNVGAIVAAPFDENTVYVVGNYVTNNGNLYRITGDHASGVAWSDTSKVQCTVGSELSDLKSALNDALYLWRVSFQVTSGTVHPSDKILDTDIKANERYYVRLDYDQSSSTQVNIKVYYSDSTNEAIGSFYLNNTYELVATKNITGIGIYGNGSIPTGKITIYCYPYGSAANVERINKTIEGVFNNALNLWNVSFPVILGTIHQSDKILDTDVKENEKYYVQLCYDQNSTAQVAIKVYYSDNTNEGLGNFIVNNTYEFTATKNIIGIGIYGNGSLPTGEIAVYCYTYDSAANVGSINNEIGKINDKLTDIGLAAKKKQVLGTILDSTYINGNGEIKDNAASNYHVLKVEVTPGKTYFINASTNWSNPFYAYYNSDMSLNEKGTSSEEGSSYSTTTDEQSVAPSGAKYLCVNYSSTSEYAKVMSFDGYEITKWSGIKWVCVGDSLTDSNQYTTKHYFDYIAEKTGITPIEEGDSGTGYKRGYDSNRAFYQRISGIDTSADVVTIFGSFNDIGAGYDLGSYTDTGTTTIAGCINTTIDNLQTIMPTVVLGIVAPTPWATARPDFHTSADNYVNMLKKIAEHRSIPYLDLFRCSNLRPWDEDFRILCYSKDISGGVLSGVHPNELGHKILAPKFEAFLDSLLLH